MLLKKKLIYKAERQYSKIEQCYDHSRRVPIESDRKEEVRAVVNRIVGKYRKWLLRSGRQVQTLLPQREGKCTLMF